MSNTATHTHAGETCDGIEYFAKDGGVWCFRPCPRKYSHPEIKPTSPLLKRLSQCPDCLQSGCHLDGCAAAEVLGKEAQPMKEIDYSRMLMSHKRLAQFVNSLVADHNLLQQRVADLEKQALIRDQEIALIVAGDMQ